MKNLLTFLICLITLSYINCLTLPSVKNYLQTHNTSENIAAIEYALKSEQTIDTTIVDLENVTKIENSKTEDNNERKSLENIKRNETNINDNTKREANINDNTKNDITKLASSIIESSETTEKDFIEIFDTTDTETEKEIKDDDDEDIKLDDAGAYKIKVPANYQQTPYLPGIPDFSLTSSSPKSTFDQPLKTPNSNNEKDDIVYKTVYVQATKTLKKQPMCITMYGFKRPCSGGKAKHDDPESDFEVFNNLQDDDAAFVDYFEGKTLREPKSFNVDVNKEHDEIQNDNSNAAPLEVFPKISRGGIPIVYRDQLEERFEDKNIPEDSGVMSNNRNGKYIRIFSPHGKYSVDGKTFPDKPIKEHIITKTIYATKVLKTPGPTATLVAKNCLPMDTDIPLCGSIYPVHKLPVVPKNNYRMPIPVYFGSHPLVTPRNSVNVIMDPNIIPNEFPTNYLPSGMVPNKFPEPPYNFPPTAFLPVPNPGFVKPLPHFQHHFQKIRDYTSQNALNFVNRVQSYFHHKHPYSQKFKKNSLPESTHFSMGSDRHNVKPVSEIVDEQTENTDLTK